MLKQLKYGLFGAPIMAFLALWAIVGDALGAFLALVVLALGVALVGAVFGYLMLNGRTWVRRLRGIARSRRGRSPALGVSMPHGFIGRPADVEAVRQDFDDFVTELESKPTQHVRVFFGFAWGNEIYESDWIELDVTGGELRARVAQAEAEGMGKIGADDLYITLPEIGVERQYCHEADIHVSSSAPRHPYVEAERQKWVDKGWEVYPCADA